MKYLPGFSILCSITQIGERWKSVLKSLGCSQSFVSRVTRQPVQESRYFGNECLVWAVNRQPHKGNSYFRVLPCLIANKDPLKSTTATKTTKE